MAATETRRKESEYTDAEKVAQGRRMAGWMLFTGLGLIGKGGWPHGSIGYWLFLTALPASFYFGLRWISFVTRSGVPVSGMDAVRG